MRNIKLFRQDILFLVILGILAALFIFQNLRKLNLENDKIEVVGRITGYYSTGKLKHYVSYVYYFDGNKYSGKKAIEKKQSNMFNDKYFVVQLSSRNPQNSNILLNLQISDTTQIVNSGFSLGLR